MQDQARAEDRVVLRVRGSASVEVAPDFAELHVRVTAEHPSDRSAALSASAAAADALRSAVDGLAPQGTVGVEVHLSSVSVRPLRRREGDGWVDAGFIATVAGCVRCGADDAGVVAGVVAASGVELNWVRWTLDADNPVHRHVRGLAVAEAERAAVDYAEALIRPVDGLTLVELADPGAGTSDRPMFARAAGDPGGAGANHELSLDPTPVKVAADVNAVYLA